MKKIILASNSPRRIEMLSKYCENIMINAPAIEEAVNQNDKPQTTVMKLALQKAYAAVSKCEEQGLIIAADTIVYLDKVLGKPYDYNDAYNMIKSLSGKSHKVYTGICIWDTVTNKKSVDYEETIVVFNDLADDEIISYLKTEEYRDKAGSYGIQGYGELLVEKIDGCYNNVKGLPLNKLNYLLKKHFSTQLL